MDSGCSSRDSVRHVSRSILVGTASAAKSTPPLSSSSTSTSHEGYAINLEDKNEAGTKDFTFRLSSTPISRPAIDAHIETVELCSSSRNHDNKGVVSTRIDPPGSLDELKLSLNHSENKTTTIGHSEYNEEHLSLLNKEIPASKPKESKHSWTYSAPNIIDWSILSQNLLTVTYTRADHAIPEYTNMNSCLDYMSRFLIGATESSTFANQAPIFSSPDNEKGEKGCCRSSIFTNRKKDVYQEVYTQDDIAKVVRLKEGLQIKGWKGRCKALQVHLISKHDPARRYTDDESDRTSTASDLSGGTVAKTGQRFPMDLKFEEGVRSSRKSVKTKKRRIQALDVQSRRRSSREKSMMESIRSRGMEDNGMPIPPWCANMEQDDDVNVREDGEAQIFGPILTFALPDMTVHNYTSSDDVKAQDLFLNCPPLLWKVDFPPDPSIALETLTVLDGMLNVDPHTISSGLFESSNDRPHEKQQSHDDDITYDSHSSSDSQLGFDEEDGSVRQPTNIYINGYQSWSYAGSVRKGEEQPTSAMPNFLSKAFNLGGTVPPQPTHSVVGGEEARKIGNLSQEVDAITCDYVTRDEKKPFNDASFYKSSFFTCVTSNDSGDNERIAMNQEGGSAEDGGLALVIGFLSQQKQYGIITFDAKLQRVVMHASLHGAIASSPFISTDWAYCQLIPKKSYDEEPMVHFLNAVAAHHDAKPLQSFPPMTGWCSWYHYYENIDSETLCNNFERLSRLKSQITSDVSIIDDGYITAWGDWTSLKSKEFPDPRSMKKLADNIETNGMTAGLWMAPYACDKNSEIAREHPDWIIKNDEGRIANSSNCGKFFYGLDATNPEVRDYAFRSVRRAVKEWGYKVLKLDFLYAACLAGNGKYDLSLSRAETMYLALKTLREGAGDDAFLIGCGCPLGPAVGIMDAMRISADTGPTWAPEFPLPWWDHSTLPSLRAMVRNSITRACLGHRWWHNDPDCVLLGETTSLTDSEVVSAATVVAMTGGMLLLSDDLSQLSAERLSIATRINPVTGVTGVVLDLHRSNKSGLPSLIRSWCTEKVHDDDAYSQTKSAIEEATVNAKMASFSSDKLWPHPSARKRTCIPVAKGLGTWSVVSMSNWLDEDHTVSVPITSLLPPESSNSSSKVDPNLGYHVYAFWSQKYIWVSGDKFDHSKTLSKKLGAHESEIFHVKPVSLDKPQYIGSDLHFTCGYEVMSFVCTGNTVDLRLKNDVKRNGFVYLHIPTQGTAITAQMNGQKARVEIVARTPREQDKKIIYAGKVVRIWISTASKSLAGMEGRLLLKYK